jgi:hypothetical protein
LKILAELAGRIAPRLRHGVVSRGHRTLIDMLIKGLPYDRIINHIKFGLVLDQSKRVIHDANKSMVGKYTR